MSANQSEPPEGLNAMTSDSDARLRFAESQQTYISGFIQLADSKCAWAFAVAAALVGYLLTNVGASPLLADTASIWARIFGMAAVILLALSSIIAFLGIAPRLRVSRSTDPFFFGTVAAHKHSADFISTIAARSPGQLIEDRLRHNYDLALVCDRKYKCVKHSFWIGFAGLCCLGLTLALTGLHQLQTCST